MLGIRSERFEKFDPDPEKIFLAVTQQVQHQKILVNITVHAVGNIENKIS
jgi:hypothetical protein